MNTRIHLILGIAVFNILFTSCDKNIENECFTACCQQVIISADEYQNAPNDGLTIDTVQIVGDCLVITFSSGGCDGDSWGIKLIDADVIMESFPPQRNLRLSLKNQELCKAIVTKVVAFDVSKLQLDYDKIKLNITNSGDQVLYEY